VSCGITRRPITSRRGTILSRVTDLINPSTGTWDKELVESIFWQDDIPKILAIPVHMDMALGILIQRVFSR
jgi:hypothetical protein